MSDEIVQDKDRQTPERDPAGRGMRDGLLASGRAKRRQAKGAVRLATVRSGPRRNDLAPELRLETWAIADLRSAEHQVHAEDPDQLARMTRTVAGIGFRIPVVITADGAIIDGHRRVETAKGLGLSHLPCIVCDDISAGEAKVLQLAANRLASTGKLNLSGLASLFQEIATLELNADLTGWEAPERELIIESQRPALPQDLDDVPAAETDAPPVCQTGDLWQCGPHWLLIADVRDPASWQTLLGDRRARMVFTDPPFGIPINGFAGGKGKVKPRGFVMGEDEMDPATFAAFLKDGLAAQMNCLETGSVLTVAMDWRHIHVLVEAGTGLGLKLINIAVWDKGAGGMGSLYRSGHELFAIFCNGKTPAINNVRLGSYGRDRTNVWSVPGANRWGSSARDQLAVHATPKPVELIAEAIRDVTNAGDLVLDGYLGSGSTLIACDVTGRVCAGTEIDPVYGDVILKRWEAHGGVEAIHVGSGLGFAALADRRLQEKEAAHAAA